MIQTQSHTTSVIDTPYQVATGMTGLCALSYSGMDHGRIVLGDGVILVQSDHALAIEGDCPVKAGMELALMVALPASDDHLCFAGARVSWIQGSAFGVELNAVPEYTRTQLMQMIQASIE